MLLTLTLPQAPATDLGSLLARNPARVQVFPLAFGSAHVFSPKAGPERCTAALIRHRQGPAGEASARGVLNLGCGAGRLLGTFHADGGDSAMRGDS